MRSTLVPALLIAAAAAAPPARAGGPGAAPREIPSVSDRAPARPALPPPRDRCGAVLAHAGDLIARATHRTLARAAAPSCRGVDLPDAVAACLLAARTPVALATCHLAAMAAPDRRVHDALAAQLADGPGDADAGPDAGALDVDRLAAASAALSGSLGGDPTRAAALVRGALDDLDRKEDHHANDAGQAVRSGHRAH